MSDSPSLLANLLADCDAHGIRLLLADDGGLTIDAPQDALTPDLLDRLKAHKAELLTLLLRASDFDIDSAPDAEPAPAALDGPQRKFADAVRQPGATCRFTMANPSGGTVAVAGGSSTFQFGTGRILDIMASIRYDTRMAKKRPRK